MSHSFAYQGAPTPRGLHLQAQPAEGTGHGTVSIAVPHLCLPGVQLPLLGLLPLLCQSLPYQVHTLPVCGVLCEEAGGRCNALEWRSKPARRRQPASANAGNKSVPRLWLTNPAVLAGSVICREAEQPGRAAAAHCSSEVSTTSSLFAAVTASSLFRSLRAVAVRPRLCQVINARLRGALGMLVKHLHCMGQLADRRRAHPFASQVTRQHRRPPCPTRSTGSAASARHKSSGLSCDSRQHPMHGTTAKWGPHHAS